jgi:hypothetical protein
MENIKVYTLVFLFAIFIFGFADAQKENNENSKSIESTHKMKFGEDDRISLNLNKMQKRHQLSNMRNHLKAVQEIISFIAEDNYDSAANIASSQLGLTKEMKMMCSNFGDAGFEKLGIAFHQSADEMSTIFRSKDKQKSLVALSKTVNYCVSCHESYRQ